MAEIELREVPLFSEMDESEVAGIRDIMEVMKFKEGQVIIREGVHLADDYDGLVNKILGVTVVKSP